MRKSKVEALIKEVMNRHENSEHILQDYKAYDESDFQGSPNMKEVVKLLMRHFDLQVKERDYKPPHRIVEKE